ncbi:MAG TPA: protein kinase [Kofleriaceae bacterium]|nr:protein kinase [Kofleriaceae bacterium]
MPASSVQAGSLVGERLGKYDILALLAIGGTAEIYLARIAGEAGFEKYVVVKCLLDHLADDADFVRMFLDEARLGAQLDHSNIVQTLELGQHNGRYYMVMEHLAGMSLAQLARKTHERVPTGVLPVEIVLGLAAQACSGLHYAHQRSGTDGKQLNVVHRDVSPQNLVVTFEGVLKIVDFGIAKADQRQTHTRSGTIKGKFAYMSPEQCLAEPIDRRTDVFALGTVVHELLTARRLFKRTNTYETYQAILKGNVPPPSRYNREVDADLDKVVLRALAYQKEERYPNAEALGEAMLGWLHKRGKAMSATDVARYVERVCAQEVEEHAEHMRELISGRQNTRTDLLRWDQDAEASEESLSLGAAPLSTKALAAVKTDYDDEASTRALLGSDGDTRLDAEPAHHGGPPAGYQVPKPATGPHAPRSPLASTQDFPPASVRPRASGLEPRAPTAETAAQVKRPVGVRPPPGGGPAASSKANAPTVLEMEAPVLPGHAPPGYSPGTPPPGPMPAGHMPSPHHAPVPMPALPPGAVPTGPPGSHPVAIYDTPMPVGPRVSPPTWDEDSSEVLRQGVARNRPGLATPSPGPYPQGASPTVPPRVLVAAFLVALAIGFTITLIIGKLAS